MPFQGDNGNGCCEESLLNSVSVVKGTIVLVQDAVAKCPEALKKAHNL
jgi:hypothetical protein